MEQSSTWALRLALLSPPPDAPTPPDRFAHDPLVDTSSAATGSELACRRRMFHVKHSWPFTVGQTAAPPWLIQVLHARALTYARRCCCQRGSKDGTCPATEKGALVGGVLFCLLLDAGGRQGGHGGG